VFAALMNPRPKASPRSFTPTEQANALGVVLRKEFGIPFVFYQATSGASVVDRPVSPADSWRAGNIDPVPARCRRKR
jgi:hypothetical protein